jgi:hypothetical protein
MWPSGTGIGGYIFVSAKRFEERYIMNSTTPGLLGILRHPVLHFLLIGLLAFAAYSWLLPADVETIRITTQTIDALVQQRESISQNQVTEDQRQELIEAHIDEEILLREAYKRGIDKNDYRVRRRILYVMRSSLTDVVPEPTVGQLRVFYEENRDRYQTSSSVSFQQVYFSFASPKLPEDSTGFIRELELRSDHTGLGDFSQWGEILRKSPFEQTALRFGKTFTERLFALPTNLWTGPIESFVGIHYVRLLERHDPETPPFESMESYLRQDYLMEATREGQQRKIDELRKDYEVVIEGVDPADR